MWTNNCSFDCSFACSLKWYNFLSPVPSDSENPSSVNSQQYAHGQLPNLCRRTALAPAPSLR